MKFNCPNCDAPFDNMWLPIQEVECPNCHQIFTPKTTAENQKSKPYTSETEKEAHSILDTIQEMVQDCEDGVKQCLLWHLEEDWLGDAGHKVTIKLGENRYVNSATCSVCGKDTTHKGLHQKAC